MRLPELDPEIEWVAMDENGRWNGYGAFDSIPYEYKGRWYAENAKKFSLAYLNIPKYANHKHSLHRLNFEENKWEKIHG